MNFESDIILKPNQKILIVADLHGCYHELLELINKSKIDLNKDYLIAVGDMIDGNLNFELLFDFYCKEENFITILGNHEIKHLKGFDKRDIDISGRLQQFILPKDTYSKILDDFRTLPLYMMINTNKKKYLVVHAGLTDDINLHNIPKYLTNFNNISKEVKVIAGIGSISNTQFNGKGVSWYDQISEKDYFIVFGHLIKQKVVYGKRNNVFGLDTGAYEGKNLTGLLLPEEKIIQVKLKKDYYQELLLEHEDDFHVELYDELTWKMKFELKKTKYLHETHERITKEIASMEKLFENIVCFAEQLRSEYVKINDTQKAKIGMNWINIYDFPEPLSIELKKAFFNNYQIKNLFKYSKKNL